MKKWILVFGLVLSSISFGQTVKSVRQDEAVVDIGSLENLSPGSKVQFLDDKLNVVGQGEVKKVSSGGSKAILKILSGNIRSGMLVEKIGDSEVITSKTTIRDPYATLSERERRILATGEISQFQYIAGGIIGTYPIGFGLGHAIQGRYTDKGWIFTVGELGSLMLFISSIGDCWTSGSSSARSCNGGTASLGIAAFVGLRIWEIVDLWATPPEHNRQLIEIKARLEREAFQFKPTLMPLADGGMLGIRASF